MVDDDDTTPPRQTTPRPYQLTEAQRDERRRAIAEPDGAPLTIDDPPSGLTDSQRDWFASRWESRVPVVRPREVCAPHQLLARTTTPDQLELLRHLRLAGDSTALAEFVVKLATDHAALTRAFNDKLEADSSDNQAALEELRTLLSRPPNGRVKALGDRVDTLAVQIGALERTVTATRSGDQVQDVKDDLRINALEGDARFARRVAYAALAFMFVSAAGVGLWLRAGGVEAGVDKQRLEYVIDAVKDLDRKLERLIRWPQATKDTTP